jgi:hypothetical protein
VAGGGSLLAWGALGTACAALVAVAAWLWQRRRPHRALRRLAAAVDSQQDSMQTLAARLDAWARARYRVARVDVAQCPSGIDPAAWSAWVKALEQLRFAPPQTAGYAALAALCETARAWERHV